MDAECKMSNSPTTWPCAARRCPLYHDCLCEYEQLTKKPPTNADRIRASTDDEMTQKIVYLMISTGQIRPNRKERVRLMLDVYKKLTQPAPEEGEQL